MEKRLILVADDDQHILDLLSYNLEQSGYAVVTARNGEGAMGVARRHSPSLAILDMLMPGVGGEETCRRLRAADATAGMPIIILSALGDEADRARALESGADDYLTKPFSVRELIARVGEFVGEEAKSAVPEKRQKARVSYTESPCGKITI